MTKSERNAYLRKIKSGVPLLEVAGSDMTLYKNLYNYCRLAGIAVTVRKVDRPYRLRAVREGRANGQTWRHIAKKISKREGRELNEVAVLNWYKLQQAA